MNIFRCIAVAFSMYSRIPMPMFKWRENDMKYSLIFFPWIGIVIAALSVLIWKCGLILELPGIVIMCLLGVFPIIVTGGFHIDGFLDVEDARRSYADKDKKLEILKDPHIGAFSVIGLVKILLLFAAGLGILVYRGGDGTMLLYGLSFVISRCVSGITAMLMNKAKKDGMLYEETKGKNKAIVAFLIIQLVLIVAIMLLVNYIFTIMMLAGLVLVVLYYKYMTNKEFGGVTGDTAGYFVVISETTMLLILAMGILLLGV